MNSKLMPFFLVPFLAISPLNAAEDEKELTPFEALVASVQSQNVDEAAILFPDAKVISWFNGRYHLESFEVMMEKFKDSERLADAEENNAVFSICDGAATYILQYRETDAGAVEIFYGTADTPPPPVPFSMRSSKSHCDGVVRYVGGL